MPGLMIERELNILAPEWELSTSMRPDKQKVVDEIWDDARVESFLHKAPPQDENPDYSVLLNAYRSMRPADFARFLTMYVAAGRDPGARGQQGETLRETIARHQRAGPFRDLLESAGG
jgi:hypothetical protein